MDFSGVGFYVPNPVGGIQHLINGMAVVAPYLTIIIPVNIYNFIETMDNVEGANAAVMITVCVRHSLRWYLYHAVSHN